MTLLAFGFVATLMITFAVVLAVTHRSVEEKSMALRMSEIHSSTMNALNTSSTTRPILLKTADNNQLGLFGKTLQHFQFGRTLQLRIMQANSSITVSALIVVTIILGLFGYAVSWLFVRAVVINIPCAIALGFIPHWILSFKRSKRISSFNAVLADTIDMLARALRAGYSMVGAIGIVADNAQQPAGSEFGEIFKQQNLGMPIRDALLQLLDRFPSLDLRVLITAILVQKDTGGNLAEILDRTVFVIRERLRIQGEIRVQTAQGRLTGWILSGLPIVMMVLINIVNPGYSNILFTDPTGRKLIYVSVVMLGVGALVIHRIVNGIEV
jgi:tight adherence protein B